MIQLRSHPMFAELMCCVLDPVLMLSCLTAQQERDSGDNCPLRG